MRNSVEVPCGDALLWSRGQQARLVNHTFGAFIESIAVTVRTLRHPRCDNGIAALANFEIAGCGDDFFRAGGPLGQVGFIEGHLFSLASRQASEKPNSWGRLVGALLKPSKRRMDLRKHGGKRNGFETSELIVPRETVARGCRTGDSAQKAGELAFSAEGGVALSPKSVDRGHVGWRDFRRAASRKFCGRFPFASTAMPAFAFKLFTEP